MKRAVVIGSGIGGLAAAIELASKGLEVQVFEARGVAGGKAGCAVLDGVEVDTGPSVLTLPGVFERLFEAVGTRLEDEVELLRSSPCFRYLYPDGTRLDLHHDLGATLDAVADTLGAEARAELEAFVGYASKIWEASADTFVFGTAPTVGTVFRFGLEGLGKVMSIDPGRTMARAIRDRVRTPHLRDLLLRYATYNGSDPRVAPATLNCIAHVELALGGFGVRGGIYALVRALTRLAERAGAELHFNAPVREIMLRGRRVLGVQLADGRRVEADAVVANADPEHVARHLLPGRIGQRLRNRQPLSTSGWTAVWKAPRDPERAPHTVVFPERYDEEFADLFDRDRPPATPTVYLCDQSRCHERPGWAEHVPVFVMANAPAEPEHGPRSAATWAELEAAVATRLRAAGLLGPGEALDLAWRRTPSELAVQYPGSRGALYGAASNSALAAFRRPPNRLEMPRGLYLASGGAHPGGGLPLCAASGHAAAEAVWEDLGRTPR